MLSIYLVYTSGSYSARAGQPERDGTAATLQLEQVGAHFLSCRAVRLAADYLVLGGTSFFFKSKSQVKLANIGASVGEDYDGINVVPISVRSI